MRGLYFVFFFWGLHCMAGPIVYLPKQDCPVSDLHKVDFFQSEAVSLSKSFEFMRPGSRATFNFFTPLVSGYGRCSGFFTSNSGHFGSALHCFNKCLLDQGYFEESSANHYIRTRKPFPAECSVLFGDDDKPTRVLIHASGGCFSKIVRGCKGDEDFVIGEIKLATTNCVKVRSTAPEIGELSTTIGYPKETHGRGLNSNGSSQYFSMGRVLENDQRKCIRIRALRGRADLTEKMNSKMNTAGLEMENTQRTSADLTSGNSGGPVVDGAGRVLGVAVAVSGVFGNPKETFGIDTDIECLGSGHFIPMKAIVDKTRKQMSEDQIKAVTECEDDADAQNRIFQEKVKNSPDPWRKLLKSQ